jgi:adenosylcobinamide kinase/adenosylcobinamide-phosphate guanylyltransferase
MRELILVLGGVRSGKSRFARQRAQERGGRVVFLATAEPGDDPEMQARIARHRAERPPEWETWERPYDAHLAVGEAAPQVDVILLDCLTVWVGNLLGRDGVAEPRWEEWMDRQAQVEEAVEQLLKGWRRGRASLIVVSNEVGLGVVPPYPLGRVFRDVLGSAHQRLAAEATEVYFLIAGLAQRLK